MSTLSAALFASYYILENSGPWTQLTIGVLNCPSVTFLNPDFNILADFNLFLFISWPTSYCHTFSVKFASLDGLSYMNGYTLPLVHSASIDKSCLKITSGGRWRLVVLIQWLLQQVASDWIHSSSTQQVTADGVRRPALVVWPFVVLVDRLPTFDKIVADRVNCRQVIAISQLFYESPINRCRSDAESIIRTR